MKVKFENGAAFITDVDEFDLRHIFENGQAFRFMDVGDGVYEGVAHGRFLRICRRREGVVLYPATKKEFNGIWRNYFDLDRDYATLFVGNTDAALQRGRDFGRGLRLLNQQPFEMLISFIISANNNLGRIRGIVKRICECCGTAFVFEGKTYYAFPTPEQLADMGKEKLNGCGCGYRAPYIADAARIVRDGFDLEALREIPYLQAKECLQVLPGVGPKVADCVLLFSLGKPEAFPADVWIKRVMKTLYGYTGTERGLHEFVLKKFGENAGIAQQYLFYYARESGLK